MLAWIILALVIVASQFVFMYLTNGPFDNSVKYHSIWAARDAQMYKRLSLFFYRRWLNCIIDERVPVGVPGMRDPDYRCNSYAPSKPLKNSWDGCEGDGHYLCQECCHFSPKQEDNDLVSIT